MLKRSKYEGKPGLRRKLMSNSDKMEIIGCIIDVFEDFLEEKGIDIKNEEKGIDETDVNIYGSDYSYISEKIEEILLNAELINPICKVTGMECEVCIKECRNRE